MSAVPLGGVKATVTPVPFDPEAGFTPTQFQRARRPGYPGATLSDPSGRPGSTTGSGVDAIGTPPQPPSGHRSMEQPGSASHFPPKPILENPFLILSQTIIVISKTNFQTQNT